MLAAIFSRGDATFALEKFSQVALIAESRRKSDVVDSQLGVLKKTACRIQPLLYHVSSGADAYRFHEHALQIGYGHAAISGERFNGDGF